ncbi:MAG: CotH kinase family protein [Ruminococcus sp.]|nr:CotH kinase family protein [Ruminococcus sp.]
MRIRKTLFCAAALVSMICQSTAYPAAQAAFDPTAGIGIEAPSVTRPEDMYLEEYQYQEIPVTSFRVSGLSPNASTGGDYVDWWFSPWEDCRFLFLPAAADLTKLRIDYEAEGTLCLDGVEVESGQTTDLLSKSQSFSVTVDGKDCGTLNVMQSNTGCIFLSTDAGDCLDALDHDKGVTVTGQALILNESGGVEYNGEIGKLSARGNSSWDYSAKKPYNLKLPVKSDLFGMGKAKKWSLLSNYLDHSLMRNKMTQEMSRAAGMEYVVDSVFVDLYADGSYRGTYELCEKIQIKKSRVNIRDLEEITEALNDQELKEYPLTVVGTENRWDYTPGSYKYFDIPNDSPDITGGYLMEFLPSNRYGSKSVSSFITTRGQGINLESPEYASKAQMEYIRQFVQDAEDAIYSEDGYNSKGKHYSDYIDVDSMIKFYLIEEISMDADSTHSSVFLWKDSDLTGDGKIHFSPVWDFDLAYGSFSTIKQNSEGDSGHSQITENLYAACCTISGYNDHPDTAGVSWFGYLYKQEDYRKRVAQIYFDDFYPFVCRLTNDRSPYVNEMASQIIPSANMNNQRWHTYGGYKYCVFGGSSGDDLLGSVDIMRGFLFRRKRWLTSLWQPDVFVKGDVNMDGEFNIADAVLTQKWLLQPDNTDVPYWQAGDLYSDGRIDMYDLVLMKQGLVE